MGILKGKEFYAFQIEPVLIRARGEAAQRWIQQLQFIDADIDKGIIAVNTTLAALVKDAGAKADSEEQLPENARPKLYRSSDQWWKTIDAVLSQPSVNSPGVRDLVATLPNDPTGGASWLDNKVLVFGGLGLALAIGYHLTKK